LGGVEEEFCWADEGLYLLAGEVLFADVLMLPNGMSKVGFIA
jgi:hypothetical protein